MNSEQTKLDRFLDDALKSYSEAEPRIGFESRIIANLGVAPVKPWWQQKWVCASAAMVVVCVMLYGAWRVGPANGWTEIAPPRPIANRMPAPEIARSPRAVSMPVRRCVQKPGQTRRNEGEYQRTILASQLPVFMPLTQQEKLLLAFARENPQEAVSMLEWQERMREPAEQPTVSDRGEQQ